MNYQEDNGKKKQQKYFIGTKNEQQRIKSVCQVFSLNNRKYRNASHRQVGTRKRRILVKVDEGSSYLRLRSLWSGKV